jgi:hypothetical protein
VVDFVTFVNSDFFQFLTLFAVIGLLRSVFLWLLEPEDTKPKGPRDGN